MALQLPAGTTKFLEFNKGDSILESDKRIGAFQELYTTVTEAIREYNANNSTLTLDQPEASYDGNTNNWTGTISYGYETIEVGGVEKEIPLVYFASYLPTAWVVPTTGELAGAQNILHALEIATDFLLRINDAIRESNLIQNARGVITKQSNNTEATKEIGFEIPFATIVNAGVPSFVATNYPAILDLQRGLLN